MPCGALPPRIKWDGATQKAVTEGLSRAPGTSEGDQNRPLETMQQNLRAIELLHVFFSACSSQPAQSQMLLIPCEAPLVISGAESGVMRHDGKRHLLGCGLMKLAHSLTLPRNSCLLLTA